MSSQPHSGTHSSAEQTHTHRTRQTSAVFLPFTCVIRFRVVLRFRNKKKPRVKAFPCVKSLKTLFVFAVLLVTQNVLLLEDMCQRTSCSNALEHALPTTRWKGYLFIGWLKQGYGCLKNMIPPYLIPSSKT